MQRDVRSGYKSYLLTVLLVILAFNSVDRAALGLLLQNIKTDLSLSDTQLGFLTGIAFALFYSLMGIPIARWADRGNRVVLIATTTALWSVAVSLCGAAGSFLQLLLIRIGVAVGEAGCVPPAHSLIAEYFTRAERPRAVARYMLGGPLSVVIGFFLAGWLNEFYGWRVAFVVLGLPGVGLAVLTWLTLKEPRCGNNRSGNVSGSASASGGDEDATAAPASANLREVCLVLWGNATFRHLLFCFSLASFFAFGIGQWEPAFFIRSYGIQTGQLGTWFALIAGVGGIAGTYLGGELAFRRAAQNESLQLRAMAVAYCGSAVVLALCFLSPNAYMAFGLLALVVVCGAAVTGPLFATIQTLVPPRMRATSIAILYLFTNLIGMGLGPLAVGMLSDAFRPWAGEESLRYALLALCPGYIWGGWHLWRASRTVMEDVSAVAKEDHPISEEGPAASASVTV